MDIEGGKFVEIWGLLWDFEVAKRAKIAYNLLQIAMNAILPEEQIRDSMSDFPLNGEGVGSNGSKTLTMVKR